MASKNRRTTKMRKYYDYIVVLLIYFVSLWIGDGDLKYAFLIAMLTIIAIGIWSKK